MAGCCQTQVGSGCCVLWPSVGSWQWAGHALWQCQGKARRAGVQTCSCLCSSPANGMGLGRPYGTCEKTGGSGGWHAESPGSLPLEIKQDRARPTWSPHDHQALWMCLLVGWRHTCTSNFHLRTKDHTIVLECFTPLAIDWKIPNRVEVFSRFTTFQ